MDKNKLIDAGVDYDEGVERFGGRPELFEKYLIKFFDSDFMTALKQQLQAKNIAGAFRVAHDLKGAAGNLSINRLLGAVSVLTDQLRAGTADADYEEALRTVERWYEKARAAVRGVEA